MKEELLKVLNIKLKYLNDNIEALNRMNTKLSFENERLDYVKSILSLFESDNNEYDIYHFEKLTRDDFNKIMMELNDDVLARFGTESCNYEGLIYLISGINKGISLTLTDEQVNAVEYLIDSIINCQMEYLARIDGILLAKSSLDISDIDELTSLKERYDQIIDELEHNEYIKETKEIIDAIDYARITNEKTIEILGFILKYNADIYEMQDKTNHKEPVSKNATKDEPKEEFETNKDVETDVDLTKDFIPQVEPINIPINEPMFDNLSFDKLDTDDLLDDKDLQDDHDEASEQDIDLENDEDISKEELNDSLNDEDNDLADLDLPEIDDDEQDDEKVDDQEITQELPTEPIDEDFKDLADKDNYEEYSPLTIEKQNNLEKSDDEEVENDQFEIETEPVSEQSEKTLEAETEPEVTSEKAIDLNETDIKDLLNEFKVKYDNIQEDEKNLLLKGNLENYRSVLNLLKDRDLLNVFEKNPTLLTNTIIYSDVETINKVLEIIEKNLSVDQDDMKITTNIVISTLPSVFIKEPIGNFETFVENVHSFKEWGIDLINLFDFSRELYVTNHEDMVHNYRVIQSYDLVVNDKNAKYYLVLPHIEEKLDYYVETVARDTMRNGTGKTFDGSEYIKLYPNKLNSVNDITIKRLKYSSQNGKKLFGSKENSLAGEITNLKVDILNMNDEYLRNYFNNEFDILSLDEIKRYSDLIENTEDYSLTIDNTIELLEKYRQGLRYVIDGVNISRNKLIRNYNILINNNVDREVALIVAACYNSVITKEEYQKVKRVLSALGGR